MPVEPPVSSPRSLSEAYALLGAEDWTPIAGGTDLMVRITGEIGEPPGRLLDIWHLAPLRGIELGPDGSLVMGALSTWTDLRRSSLVLRHLPVLAEAAATIGAAQIQNRGTIGGNVVNASPAGDSLPVLLATDATMVLGSARGERAVAASDFWPGYRLTARRPDELPGTDRHPVASRPSGALPQGRHAAGTGHLQGRDGGVVAHGRTAVARCSGGARLRRGDTGPGAGRRGRAGRERRGRGDRGPGRCRDLGPRSRPSTTSDPRRTTGARSPGASSTGSCVTRAAGSPVRRASARRIAPDHGGQRIGPPG